MLSTGLASAVLGAQNAPTAYLEQSFLNMSPGATLPSIYSVTRASVDYALDSSGIFQQVASGSPSFWYGKGLAVFGAATNLALWSSDLSQATWTKTNLTTATDATYIQGNTATLLTRNSTVAACNVQQLLTPAAGTYTVWVLAKTGGVGNRLGLRIQGAYPNRVDAVFDLSAGSIVGTANGGTATSASAVMAPLGGGVYLCALTGVLADTLSRIAYGPTDSSLAVGSWESASAVLSSAIVGHAQLVTGTRIVPPIVTNAATASRAADVPTIAVSSLPFLSANPASLYFGAQIETLQGQDATGRIFLLDDGTANNRFGITWQATDTLAGTIVTGGVSQFAPTASSSGAGIKKAAISATTNAGLSAFNGVAGSSTASLSMATGMTTLRIGCGLAGAEQLNGFIGSIYAGPTTQAQAWLNARTT